MKYDYQIVVIGAGTAGLVAAATSAGLGAKIALIEENKMGGTSLHYGSVPSKAFLKSAHLFKNINDSSMYGIDTGTNKINLEKVMRRVRTIINEIAPFDSEERFTELGVDVIKGHAELVDAHTIKVNEQEITSKHIVLATGSRPAIPPVPGLKDVGYLTNETVFNMKELPEKLIVLGAGYTGLELGQGFAHCGSKVAMIDMSETIFSDEDPEVGQLMKPRLESEGIEFYLSSNVTKVEQVDEGIKVILNREGQEETITGDAILVATGRKPFSFGLGLDKVGIKTDKDGYIMTNSRLQTSVKNIYACGDVTGPFLFTHMANYQASVAIRNMVFKLPAKINYSQVTWTVFTKPAVAHVGINESMAKSRQLDYRAYKFSSKGIHRAIIENNKDGFLKIITDSANRIIGVTLVAENASEILPQFSIAVKKKFGVTYFLDLIYSYPTESEIAKNASLKIARLSIQKWMKRFIRNVLLK